MPTICMNNNYLNTKARINKIALFKKKKLRTSLSSFLFQTNNSKILISHTMTTRSMAMKIEKVNNNSISRSIYLLVSDSMNALILIF